MASFVPAGIAGLLGLDSGETWQDRVKPGVYISPKGTRIRFDFEDVSREVTKRGTLFEFPDVNDGYIQQRGFGPRRYPLRCFFSGADHDRVATAFEVALLEPGIGKLEHPLYGTIPRVVPFGDITRNDALKTAANQTVIEVTFWTTTGAVYPSETSDGKNELVAALGNFDVAAAQQFADKMDLIGTLKKANAKATIKKFLRETSAALQSVSDSVTSVRREVEDIQSTVNLGLDVFVGQPLLLARQVVNLVRAPSRALLGIESRLAGYQRLAESIFASAAATPADTLNAGSKLAVRMSKLGNDLHLSDLFASAAVAGSVASTLNNQFSTRTEALTAADGVLSQFDAFVGWRDLAFEAVEAVEELHGFQVDTGAAYQQLLDAVAVCAGFLVDISFSLVPERRIIIDRPRTIIDLCAEVYGAVDSRLDFLIESNELTGDEILELPRGKSIAYYPPAR